MSARAELLFLSRRAGFMPGGRAAGGTGQLEIRDELLCGRVSDFPGRAVRAVCVRVSVSVRAFAGPAGKNSGAGKEEEFARAQVAEMAEVRSAGCVRSRAAALGGGHGRTGAAVVLQMDLPFGHGQRLAADDRGAAAAFAGGVPVWLEERAVHCNIGSERVRAQAVLQIPLPAWRSLWHGAEMGAGADSVR